MSHDKNATAQIAILQHHHNAMIAELRERMQLASIRDLAKIAIELQNQAMRNDNNGGPKSGSFIPECATAFISIEIMRRLEDAQANGTDPV